MTALRRFNSSRRHWLAALALFFCVFALYWPATHNGFIETYDDAGYVTANLRVQQGLTWDNLRAAFTSSFLSNWHPLTILSHMADCQFYGLKPWGHHLGNVLLHALNSAALFLVLRGLTGHAWHSLIVAALFAVHPQHVECVAFVSQRKDVLSTFFWILAMGAYGRYAARPRVSAYALVAVLFSLGLLSKPMVVTFPFVLMLLDLWPLRRIDMRETNWRRLSKRAGLLALEKAPLIALSAGASVVTYMVQSEWGAVAAVEQRPLIIRLENAALACVRYLGQTFFPVGLSPHYPYPVSIPVWQWAGALILLASISVAAIAIVRRKPYAVVGWFWFLGTLVPVIGIVQVGVQSMADRYMYVPHIGLFMAVVWLCADVGLRFPSMQLVWKGAVPVVLALLSAQTWVQTGYWKDAETLWSRAVAVDPGNVRARHLLASYYLEQGRLVESLAVREEALGVRRDAATLTSMGEGLAAAGRLAEAEAVLLESIALPGDHSEAHYYLGAVYATLGDFEKAESYYLRVPNPNAGYHVLVGRAFMNVKAYDYAEAHFRAAIALDPRNAGAYANLGRLMEETGFPDLARVAYENAITCDGSYTATLNRRIVNLR